MGKECLYKECVEEDRGSSFANWDAVLRDLWQDPRSFCKWFQYSMINKNHIFNWFRINCVYFFLRKQSARGTSEESFLYNIESCFYQSGVFLLWIGRHCMCAFVKGEEWDRSVCDLCSVACVRVCARDSSNELLCLIINFKKTWIVSRRACQ